MASRDLTSTLPADRAMIGSRAVGPSIGYAVSADGTRIGYRQFGHGPGIVVVHGAMESSVSHQQLAEALAGTFTVYLIDRRGRGLSGAYPADHEVVREVEDVAAVLAATGAGCVFGVSSGGVIALESALTVPSIRKIAVYEPALVDDPVRTAASLERYEREMASGQVAAALVTAMKVTQMGPRIFNVIPGPILASMTGSMIKKQDREAAPDSVTMRRLAPTLHYDFEAVLDGSRRFDEFRDIRTEILLLGGSKSPAYLRHALDRLQRILTAARRVEFSGLGHGGSGNKDWGGKPEVVSKELMSFFGR